MGLDQYIYRIKLIECPHCKEKLPIVDINRYNNDEDYRYYGVSYAIESCCYWRKNYDLQNYMFGQGLYSDELYAKFAPLTADDLKGILKHNGSLYDDNAQNIKAAIIDTENGEAVYCYCADW